MPGTSKRLADAHIDLRYLCTWKDVLAFLKQRGADVTRITAFLADPLAWSVAHGGPAPEKGGPVP